MTQEAHVLRILKSGRTLTQLQALEEVGTLRLAARVHQLRDKGWKIETERKSVSEDCSIAVYHLPREGWAKIKLKWTLQETVQGETAHVSGGYLVWNASARGWTATFNGAGLSSGCTTWREARKICQDHADGWAG